MPRCRRWVTTRRNGVLPLQLAQHPRALVAGAVVHDHHFEGKPGGRECLGAEPDELGKVGGLVLGRYEDADIQRLGGKGHTRFRIRAGRIPSWSRYLATVRRAIWMPCS